jgi:hypothetical protein
MKDIPMAFPTPATKIYLDAASDDPKAARPELASLVDKFNQLLTEVKATTGQQAYDMAWPLHSIMTLDWDSEPQVPDGITASWTAIGSGRFLKTVSSGAGVVGGSSSATTGSAGSHSHGGETAGHALTVGQLPAHQHYVARNTAGNGTALSASNSLAFKDETFADNDYQLTGVSGAANVGESSATGSGSTHKHTISADGSHTHTVAINDPPHFKVRAWRRTA